MDYGLQAAKMVIGLVFLSLVLKMLGKDGFYIKTEKNVLVIKSEGYPN